MGTALEHLDELIAMFDALDTDTLTDDQLHELTVGLQQARSRLGSAPGAAWPAGNGAACGPPTSPAPPPPACPAS